MNKQNKNYSLIEGWLSIVVNTLLFGLKYWAGIVTGSVALIADAWHTLSDSISSVVVIISSKISNKPADKEHPFGHGRADLVSSIIIGFFLTFIGVEFIIKSIDRLKGGEIVIFGTVAVVVTIVSIIFKELLAQYAFWAAKKSNSQILKADGWHHRTDALSSVIVLVGIALGRLFWWIDGVLGLIIAAMIFYAAYEILRDSINRLLGEVPDKKLVQDINQVIFGLKLNVCPHHFHMHRYGQHIELTFHILFPPDITLKEAHDKTNLIENAIRDNFKIETTIHMEPDETGNDCDNINIKHKEL
jgi:cation diffusion facilitator family transporter